jgi:hypothetical protein
MAMVAAERHRLAFGTIPRSLAELDPRFATGLTPDPYTGAPIRFQPLPDRLVIYSVGVDREDDGGKLDPKNRPTPGTDQGWTLWTTSQRRLAPKDELPADVFQSTPGERAGAQR